MNTYDHPRETKCVFLLRGGIYLFIQRPFRDPETWYMYLSEGTGMRIIKLKLLSVPVQLHSGSSKLKISRYFTIFCDNEESCT